MKHKLKVQINLFVLIFGVCGEENDAKNTFLFIPFDSNTNPSTKVIFVLFEIFDYKKIFFFFFNENREKIKNKRINYCC